MTDRNLKARRARAVKALLRTLEGPGSQLRWVAMQGIIPDTLPRLVDEYAAALRKHAEWLRRDRRRPL